MNHGREIQLDRFEGFEMSDGTFSFSIEDDEVGASETLTREQARALADWLLLRLGQEG